MTFLLDLRMHDGSRHFAGLPQSRMWYDVRDHVRKLPGACVTGCIDGVIEAWIHFTWRGHAFSIHDPCNDYWFFVQDPGCPDEILAAVVHHFERLLGR